MRDNILINHLTGMQAHTDLIRLVLSAQLILPYTSRLNFFINLFCEHNKFEIEIFNYIIYPNLFLDGDSMKMPHKWKSRFVI